MKSITVLFTTGFVLVAAPVLACDNQEATDLMVKVVTALGEKGGQSQTAEDSERISAALEKVNEAGEVFAAGDVNKACEMYRGIAKEEGISLQ